MATHAYSLNLRYHKGVTQPQNGAQPKDNSGPQQGTVGTDNGHKLKDAELKDVPKFKGVPTFTLETLERSGKTK